MLGSMLLRQPPARAGAAGVEVANQEFWQLRRRVRQRLVAACQAERRTVSGLSPSLLFSRCSAEPGCLRCPGVEELEVEILTGNRGVGGPPNVPNHGRRLNRLLDFLSQRLNAERLL